MYQLRLVGKLKGTMMKLRIRQNSLRLRMDRIELEQLAAEGRVENEMVFGPNETQKLQYSIEWRSQEMPLAAEFDSAGGIRLYIRQDTADQLQIHDEVGISAEQPIGNGGMLQLAVQKDFACLQPRANEDDTLAFDNLAAKHVY